jgi:hypothetical protein
MSIMDTLKKPLVMAALAFIVGIVLGLTYAYAIDPVKWTNTPLTWADPTIQEEYLRATIDSYRVNRDGTAAARRYGYLQSSGPEALANIEANPDTIDPRVLNAFKKALADNGAANPETPTDTPAAESGGISFLTIAIIVGSLIVLTLVGAALFWLFRSNRRAPEDMTPAMLAAEHSRSVEKTDYSTVSSTPPVAQYVTTYVLGDDLFDDSFSIDAPTGEFLGECGVGISETVGVGDPKKVTAFEVWMFDKNDIQTVTKVLMSSNAFSDMALRAKLEPKGELVQVDPRKQVLLETQTLQMIATISDMQYGQGALPNGSYFDRITIELAIWQKAK